MAYQSASMGGFDQPLPATRRFAVLLRTIRVLLRGPRPETFPRLAPEHLPEMHERVEILRDARGVPHVFANVERDLYAALGFLQGADRFVLLDILRHLGSGRLSELIGNPRMPKSSEIFPGKRLSDLDGFVRPLDFEAASERDYQNATSNVRDCLDAFAAGINAALRAMQGIYPPEYVLLGRLRPWRPSDALIAARTCALCVALATLDNELMFDAVRGQLGDERARNLFPDAPWDDAPAGYRVAQGSEPEPPMHLSGTGSNNWAVGSARSASGAPLFANDPHVPFLPLPTFWYHAHLDCPDYRIQGGLMLGCPIFGYGHNGHLAWGVTTAYRDAWDLYRVHRLPEDPSRYRNASGVGALERHREKRAVRFARPLFLEWESCEHGILYDGWKHHDGTDLALRYAPSDAGRFVAGYLKLAAAKTVDEHRAALEIVNDGPFDFNHVYAHKDGHIAWEQYGRLPRRRVDGLFVRDAQDPDAQWDGFLSFSENPKSINPQCGFVATANSITDPSNFKTLTTRVHAESRYRQIRIENFLSAGTRHTTNDFAALQSDIASDYALPVRDALVALLESRDYRTASLEGDALRQLREWDGRFDVGSRAATTYAWMQRELATCCFIPLLGSAVARRYINSRRAVPRLHRALLNPTDPLRADIEKAAGTDFARLVVDAFSATIAAVRELQGDQPSQWRWGKTQFIRLATPLGELPVIGRWFRALEAPFPGDFYSVSPSIAVPAGRRLRSFAGATSRFICDLSRPDEALFAHSSGPSADVGSTFFANLSEPWLRFEYFRSALWRADEVPDVVERVVLGTGR